MSDSNNAILDRTVIGAFRDVGYLFEDRSFSLISSVIHASRDGLRLRDVVRSVIQFARQSGGNPSSLSRSVVYPALESLVVRAMRSGTQFDENIEDILRHEDAAELSRTPNRNEAVAVLNLEDRPRRRESSDAIDDDTMSVSSRTMSVVSSSSRSRRRRRVPGESFNEGLKTLDVITSGSYVPSKQPKRTLSVVPELSDSRLSLNSSASISPAGANSISEEEKIALQDQGLSGNSPLIDYVDVFRAPKLSFDHSKRRFVSVDRPPSIFGSANDKIKMCEDRYTLVAQRVKRDPKFCPPAIETPLNRDQTWTEISTVQELLGSSGEARCILGSVFLGPDSCWYLEDLSASVRLVFPPEVSLSKGFFTESSTVLIRGRLNPVTTCFEVSKISQPPYENREATLRSFSGTDFFGSALSSSDARRMAELESRFESAEVLIFSDVWLDKEEVFRKLEFIFSAFDHEEADVLPWTFVFMGSFLSYKFGSRFTDRLTYTQGFDRLCNLFKSHPNVSDNCEFLFIPGPNDPNPCSCLPFAPLPKIFTKSLRDTFPQRCKFLSNPCRVRFFSREIVFFRDDVLRKLRRHCVMDQHFGHNDESLSADSSSTRANRLREEARMMTHHLFRTLMSQSHLCPLPIHVQPVYWQFDHALYLYPAPHMLIIGDQTCYMDGKYNDCLCFQVGPFAVEHRFVSLQPLSSTVTFHHALPPSDGSDGNLLREATIDVHMDVRGSIFDSRPLIRETVSTSEVDLSMDSHRLSSSIDLPDLMEERPSLHPLNEVAEESEDNESLGSDVSHESQASYF